MAAIPMIHVSCERVEAKFMRFSYFIYGLKRVNIFQWFFRALLHPSISFLHTFISFSRFSTFWTDFEWIKQNYHRKLSLMEK